MVDRTGDYGSQFFGIGSCMVVAGLLIAVVSVTSLDQRYGVLQSPAPDQRDTAPDQPAAEA